MLYIIISTVVMLGVLDRALRLGRLDNLKLKTRFRLFAFRDELRLELIRGEVPANQWFDYLDTTLTRSIDSLDHINFWEAVALSLHYAEDPDMKAAVAKKQAALSDPVNSRLVELQTRYVTCLAEFMMERHFGKIFLQLTNRREREASVNRIQRPRENPKQNIKPHFTAQKLFSPNLGFVKIFTSAPETSTLLRYANI